MESFPFFSFSNEQGGNLLFRQFGIHSSGLRLSEPFILRTGFSGRFSLGVDVVCREVYCLSDRIDVGAYGDDLFFYLGRFLII